MKIEKKPTQILIVEDDPMAAAATEAALLLIEKPIETTIARTSMKALQLLQSKDNQFKLIILDLDLETEGSGMAVLVKASTIPTIVVTGRTTADVDADITRKTGVINFFTKPIDPEPFSETARNILQVTGAFYGEYNLPGCTYNTDTGIFSIEGENIAHIGDVGKQLFDLLVEYYPDPMPISVAMDQIYSGYANQKSALYKAIARLKEVLIENGIPLSVQSVRGRNSPGYFIAAAK